MSTKILIVDDEPAIGKLLTYQLQSNDYAVSYVSDGFSALERIERERPDLVLLDVMMPTISGWEVCRQIRSSSNVPVIMLTAKSSDADIVTGLTAGADDYIAKPFNMVQLQARIEAVLRRSRTGSRPRIPVVNAQPVEVSVAPTPTQPTPPAAPSAPDTPVPPVEVPPTPVADQLMRLGSRLRAARVARNITLAQAARECNTRWEFLQALEQENYAYVPRAQLRPTLQRYSRYLHIDTTGTPLAVPSPRPHHNTLQYATIITLVLLVLAVGLYLLEHS